MRPRFSRGRGEAGEGEKEGRFLPASLNTARKPSLRTLPEFYFFHQLGDPLFFLRLASSDRPKFLAFSKKKKLAIFRSPFHLKKNEKIRVNLWSTWKAIRIFINSNGVFSRPDELIAKTIELWEHRGGTRHIKGVGMLVVSLRGLNFGVWSHLGCSGQNAIIFSREGLV